MHDTKRIQVFLGEFEKDVKALLELRLRFGFNLEAKLGGMWLYWDKKEQSVELMLPIHDEAVEFLNKDNDAKRYVGRALARYYRYEGTFNFAIDDIPF